MFLRRLRAADRRRPLVFDAGLGALLFVIELMAVRVGPHGQAPRTPGWPDYLVAVTGFAVLLVRRRWTREALIVAAGMETAFIILREGREPALIVATIVLTATLALRTASRSSWLIAAGCSLVLFVAGGLFTENGWWSPENVGVVAWLGMATAAGNALRNRRAYVAEVEARAVRAEESREEEARRRVAEERLRIARELHDVVAHHIAVINVQAGAAAHVLQTRPEAVGPALAHIRRASDTVLKELAAVVGVLRNDESPTEPTRGLARLSDLLDSFAASGLRVGHRQHGEARDLPAVVDLAAYRIIQESLTNAQKHGSGDATLDVSYTHGGVVVEVRNAVAAEGKGGGGSGYGIIGMRERAAAAGGTLTAAPSSQGHFLVRSELPAAADSPAEPLPVAAPALPTTPAPSAADSRTS